MRVSAGLTACGLVLRSVAVGGSRRIIFAGLTAVAVLAVAVPAQAAFPGQNGKITFASDRSPSGMYAMNPDGSAPTRTPGLVSDGAWSPDGQKRVQGCGTNYLCVVTPDGTFVSELEVTGDPAGLSWSPDNYAIAWGGVYVGACCLLFDGIGVVNEDNTGYAVIIDIPEGSPAWSPTATRSRSSRTSTIRTTSAIFVVDADGPRMSRHELNLTKRSEEIHGLEMVSGRAKDRLVRKFIKTGRQFNFNAPSPSINADGTQPTGSSSGPIPHTSHPRGLRMGRRSPYTPAIEAATRPRSGCMNPDGSGQTNITNNPA